MQMVEKNEESVWTSIDDLLAEANAVQVLDVSFHGKMLRVHWVELEIGESPSIASLGMTPDDDMEKVGRALTNEIVWAMIDKAQRKLDEEGEKYLKISRQKWDRLPNNLKNVIQTKILDIKSEKRDRFLGGQNRAVN